MIRLSKAQVLMLHAQLIEATGGSPGMRDEAMLDSALSNPFQSLIRPQDSAYPVSVGGLLPGACLAT